MHSLGNTEISKLEPQLKNAIFKNQSIFKLERSTSQELSDKNLVWDRQTIILSKFIDHSHQQESERKENRNKLNNLVKHRKAIEILQHL